MTPILILKTGALGDVLRTTSILPGLHAAHADPRVTWVTAPGARDLVRTHPLVATVRTVDPGDADAVRALGDELARTRWSRVLSFDDEEPMCALASAVAAGADVCGAYLDERAERAYTPNAAPWFDMGLLSVHGKARADELKLENRRSHAAIYADMLGIEMGEPELVLPDDALEFGAAFAREHGLDRARPVVGLNTGAGGRWQSKRLPAERTVELALALFERLERRASFVVLGGPDEAERNRRIADALAGRVPLVDAGADNALLEFAAIVDRLDLLVTSDSLALHVAVARRVPLVAFFAPTSAAEIELYGRGEKVASTAPDACSYRPDADTSTLTTERLVAACERALARAGAGS